jgi:hypothetical protein
MAQVVECLANKCEVLSSNPNAASNKKEILGKKVKYKISNAIKEMKFSKVAVPFCISTGKEREFLLFYLLTRI